MSLTIATCVLLVSLMVTVGSYVSLSRFDHSYINVLFPSFLITVPASYLFPWVYMQLFGLNASLYGFSYVYLTLAISNVAFVYGYRRVRGRAIHLPGSFAYGNVRLLAWIFVMAAFLLY